MSWFPKREGFYLGDLPQSVCPDEPAGAEIAPGVILERRSFVWVSTAALLGLPNLAFGKEPPANPTSGQPKPGSQAAASNVSNPADKAAPSLDAMTFKRFLELAKPLAKNLVSSKEPQEDAYLHQLAAMLLRVSALSDVQFHHALPLVIFQMKLKAGAKITLHDHLNYNGLLVGLKGHALVRNFEPIEPLPELDADKSFKIKETVSMVLAKGRTSTLSRSRDNFHEITAGKDGARLLDVFTYFKGKAGSRMVEFNDKPLKGETNVYEVAWEE